MERQRLTFRAVCLTVVIVLGTDPVGAEYAPPDPMSPTSWEECNAVQNAWRERANANRQAGSACDQGHMTELGRLGSQATQAGSQYARQYGHKVPHHVRACGGQYSALWQPCIRFYEQYLCDSANGRQAYERCAGRLRANQAQRQAQEEQQRRLEQQRVSQEQQQRRAEQQRQAAQQEQERRQAQQLSQAAAAQDRANQQVAQAQQAHRDAITQSLQWQQQRQQELQQQRELEREQATERFQAAQEAQRERSAHQQQMLEQFARMQEQEEDDADESFDDGGGYSSDSTREASPEVVARLAVNDPLAGAQVRSDEPTGRDRLDDMVARFDEHYGEAAAIKDKAVDELVDVVVDRAAEAAGHFDPRIPVVVDTVDKASTAYDVIARAKEWADFVSGDSTTSERDRERVRLVTATAGDVLDFSPHLGSRVIAAPLLDSVSGKLSVTIDEVFADLDVTARDITTPSPPYFPPTSARVGSVTPDADEPRQETEGASMPDVATPLETASADAYEASRTLPRSDDDEADIEDDDDRGKKKRKPKTSDEAEDALQSAEREGSVTPVSAPSSLW
jgi:hypothetical protein